MNQNQQKNNNIRMSRATPIVNPYAQHRNNNRNNNHNNNTRSLRDGLGLVENNDDGNVTGGHGAMNDNDKNNDDDNDEFDDADDGNDAIRRERQLQYRGTRAAGRANGTNVNGK